MQQASKALCVLALFALVAGSQGVAVTFWNNCGCYARLTVDMYCEDGYHRWDQNTNPDYQAPFHCSASSYGYWMMTACRSQVPWRFFRFDRAQTIRICDYDKETDQGLDRRTELEIVSKKPSLRSQFW